MLRISSVWRIRQIKFQKQFKKCKHFIPVFEILLGSEQLQIIMPFMVEIRLWKTANRWVSFVWDKQLWQYKYNIHGYAAITKKIKLVYMRNKIRYIIKKIKKTVDNLNLGWYYIQAVSENNAKQYRISQIKKKFENKWKKLLTNFFWFDKIDKLLQTSGNELW